MPYAQVHYPFDAKQSEGFLEHRFPADFIAEGLDQTRGWFYTLMVRENAAVCVCVIAGAHCFVVPATRTKYCDGVTSVLSELCLA